MQAHNWLEHEINQSRHKLYRVLLPKCRPVIGWNTKLTSHDTSCTEYCCHIRHAPTQTPPDCHWPRSHGAIIPELTREYPAGVAVHERSLVPSCAL
jgi:hypothetical protein